MKLQIQEEIPIFTSYGVYMDKDGRCEERKWKRKVIFSIL